MENDLGGINGAKEQQKSGLGTFAKIRTYFSNDLDLILIEFLKNKILSYFTRY